MRSRRTGSRRPSGRSPVHYATPCGRRSHFRTARPSSTRCT
jgi:hypothetical protein